MDANELKVLQRLDAALASDSARVRINEIISRVEQGLMQKPDELLAWEPIPLDVYDARLPDTVLSSWVFVLRAGSKTGAERHPNSHQRMMSFRGRGVFQTRVKGHWTSYSLSSDPAAPIEERWISIPADVWHQGVIPDENWVLVSFHTVKADELIEERPDTEDVKTTRQKKYIGDHPKSGG